MIIIIYSVIFMCQIFSMWLTCIISFNSHNIPWSSYSVVIPSSWEVMNLYLCLSTRQCLSWTSIKFENFKNHQRLLIVFYLFPLFFIALIFQVFSSWTRGLYLSPWSPTKNPASPGTIQLKLMKQRVWLLLILINNCGIIFSCLIKLV